MIKFVVILAVIVLITIIALMLGRALRGPTVFNRMNALGVISADTIILIVLFGYGGWYCTACGSSGSL